MKALYNPKTGMVLSWNELKANMGHLQEIEVADKSALNKPYDSSVPPKPLTEIREGFPHAEEKYLDSSPDVEATDSAIEPPPSVEEDEFNVDDL